MEVMLMWRVESANLNRFVFCPDSSKQYPRCEKGNTPHHPGLRSCLDFWILLASLTLCLK